MKPLYILLGGITLIASQCAAVYSRDINPVTKVYTPTVYSDYPSCISSKEFKDMSPNGCCMPYKGSWGVSIHDGKTCSPLEQIEDRSAPALTDSEAIIDNQLFATPTGGLPPLSAEELKPLISPRLFSLSSPAFLSPRGAVFPRSIDGAEGFIWEVRHGR